MGTSASPEKAAPCIEAPHRRFVPGDLLPQIPDAAPDGPRCADAGQAAGRLVHPAYRADIDGLRAIAVLAVVGFHAFPNWVKGGFTGVDIFFVISGFLISTIVLLSLERKTYSFYEFYGRRIRRIFPALLVVLIACLAIGWLVLFTNEYEQLGKHITGGASFASNFVLWWESGYFDETAETKPLLHLWSLGIEEQFYIIWPLLLWLAWKRRANLVSMALGIVVLSFAYNIYRFRSDTIEDFYSPQTRFWELLAGALLAGVMLNRRDLVSAFEARPSRWGTMIRSIAPAGQDALRNALSILGALSILTGILMSTKDARFPGFWAVLPVMGAVLIIAAGSRPWLNRRLLSSRILVWFGLISFPLYLWHWPLLSFARIVESGPPNLAIRSGIVVLSIALAWATYALIEHPFRFGRYTRIKAAVLLVAMMMLGVVGFGTWSGAGLAPRLKGASDFLNYFENSRPDWRYFQKIDLLSRWRSECAFFDTEKYRDNKLGGTVRDSAPRPSLDRSCYERDHRYEKAVLLWGDSHAQQLAPGLAEALPRTWQRLQVASSGCSPDVDQSRPSASSQCNQSNYFALKTIGDARPDAVVIAQIARFTPQWAYKMSDTLKKLGVKRIVFVGPVPQWNTDLPKLLARSSWPPPRRTFVGVNKDVLDANAKLQRELKTDSIVKFANASDTLCDSEGCIVRLGDDLERGITSWDDGHLTPIASEYLAKYLLADVIMKDD
jgi:peptidoglycan/LPS O-acetylase OafA/YrhL